ncbi:MAG TPA: alpha/beta fold hydrolase [Ensifer sp.]|nr:alpha/beta fold hydrolase [Ensifer sp.]
MTVFVLVAGAWHGAWCWERITPALVAQGHTVIAPDLLGMGDDPTPIKEASIGRWADQVADIVREQPEPVILVGHSRGGVVISEVAERVPDNIARLVYLTAFLVPSGLTLLDMVDAVPVDGHLAPLVGHPNGTTTIMPERLAAHFYNNTPAEWIERAREKACAEPDSSFTTPLALTEERYGRVPRAYIRCQKDQAIVPALQAHMLGLLPCHPVLEIDTDHSPFFSAPDTLVGQLDDIARIHVARA